VVARGEPRAAVNRVLAAIGGIRRFVEPGRVILLKPNIGFDSPPEWGATTHPEVLAALIEACIEAGARRVLVAEHTIRPADRCFERSGLGAIVASFPKAQLVSLDREPAYEETDIPAGKALKKTRVAALVRKVDLFINVPAAKSHSASRISLGLKNLMGLVWDRHVFHSDIDLHQGIADLATILRPQLTILDATRVLKTGGPSGPGDVETCGRVIAGVDPVAVDAYGTGLAPWGGETLRPDQIPHIRYAGEMGLGTYRLDGLRIAESGG
jgi:uncharacterized protein (DUF362 family)